MTRGADLRTQSPGQASAPSVGTRALRKEDDPLLRGAGAFVDDLREPGTLEAAFLRSPYPHAILGAIDSTAAEALDGVVAVYTAADLPGGGPPIPMRMFIQPGMERFLQSPLATDRVRYVGEPVAVVVARSLPIARCSDTGPEHVCCPVGGGLLHHLPLSTDTPTEWDISDQQPYGYWKPGGWAWELTDPQLTTERCPWCLIHPAFDNGSPPAPARDCPVCGGAGRCDPIPVKGRQGVWQWDGTRRPT